MHSTALRVPDVRSYRFITPNTSDAPKLCRDHVAWLVRHARSPVAEDVVRLLVSELVTNAYLHTAASRVSLTTTILPGRVHVDVYDTDPSPLPRAACQGAALVAECGRGLRMVEELAARWGWELCGGAEPFGKSVWFELRPG